MGPYLVSKPEESPYGSLGRPARGCEFKIENRDGTKCAPNEVGELVVRGPTGTLYWGNTTRQRKSVKDGWCLTGDMAYEDENHDIWYVGRKSASLKIGGFLVSPEEVEATIREDPMVKDVAVIGQKDNVLGTVLKALIRASVFFGQSTIFHRQSKVQCQPTIEQFQGSTILVNRGRIATHSVGETQSPRNLRQVVIVAKSHVPGLTREHYS